MLGNTTVFYRGSTVTWTTTFYNTAKAVVQPDSATSNIVAGSAAAVSVTMSPVGGGSLAWSGEWDSRGIKAPITIYWSIHTGNMDPIPVAVEDGQFKLSANPANLTTF